VLDTRFAGKDLNPVWLAPLAGITIPAVRKFYKALGAGLTHTEMISCAGLVHGSKKTFRMMETFGEAPPVVIQLFAGDTDTLLKGAELALKQDKWAAISINMACPMPKVLKKGAGASLLKNIEGAERMIKGLMVFQKPVWIKIRKISDNYSDTLAFIDRMISAGAVHVSLHGRTPKQKYEGYADKNVVFEAAKRFPGYISGSGDVFTVNDALDYLENGCVAVLLARGAMKDPFIVPSILQRLDYEIANRTLCDPSVKERIALFRTFAYNLREEAGENLALILIKRLVSGIFRGFNGVSTFRRNVGSAKKWDDFETAIIDFLDHFERGKELW